MKNIADFKLAERQNEQLVFCLFFVYCVIIHHFKIITPQFFPRNFLNEDKWDNSLCYYDFKTLVAQTELLSKRISSFTVANFVVSHPSKINGFLSVKVFSPYSRKLSTSKETVVLQDHSILLGLVVYSSSK